MEDEHAKGEQQCDFNEHQHQAAADQREQKIGAAHGRSHKTLKQFPLPHFHQRESDAPHAGVHQVHAQQARNQEVDIARTRLARRLRYRVDGIPASRGGLQSVIYLGTRQHTFGTRRIVTEVNSRVVHRYDQRVLAKPEAVECGGRAHYIGLNAGVFGRALQQVDDLLRFRSLNHRNGR
jgi:hypothetical protein